MKKTIRPVMASYDDEYLSDLIEGVRSLVNDPNFKDYTKRLEDIYEIIRWNINDEDKDEVLYQLTHPAYNSGDNFVRFYHLCENVTRLLRERGYN